MPHVMIHSWWVSFFFWLNPPDFPANGGAKKTHVNYLSTWLHRIVSIYGGINCDCNLLATTLVASVIIKMWNEIWTNWVGYFVRHKKISCRDDDYCWHFNSVWECVSPLVVMEQKIKVTQIEAMAVRVKPNGHVELIDA